MKITKDGIEMTIDEIGQLVGDESFAGYLKSRIVNFGAEYQYDKVLRRKILVLYVPRDTELNDDQIKIKYDCLSKVVLDAIRRNVLIKIVPSDLEHIRKMDCYVGNPDSVAFIQYCLKKMRK